MVIKKGYDPLLVQEIMAYFFGIGCPEGIEPASQKEIETFLDLLENPAGGLLAIDFLNAWLIGRGQPKIPDRLLNSLKQSVKINNKQQKRKPKKVTKEMK